MTLDLIDPARGPWEQGDFVVQVDLLDAPGQHYSTARGVAQAGPGTVPNVPKRATHDVGSFSPVATEDLAQVIVAILEPQ